VTSSADEAEPRDDVAALTSALLTASRLLVAVSVRSLSATHERVTLPQFRVLVILAHGETKLVTLADRLAVNPSTALRMIDRLAEAGYVGRKANPRSGREVLVRLTESGRRIVDEVTGRRRAEISAIVARMSDEDRTWLIRALRQFALAGEEPSADQIERDLVPLGWE
jgi:DNA-binding MarR family transcriptional regulator